MHQSGGFAPSIDHLETILNRVVTHQRLSLQSTKQSKRQSKTCRRHRETFAFVRQPSREGKCRQPQHMQCSVRTHQTCMLCTRSPITSTPRTLPPHASNGVASPPSQTAPVTEPRIVFKLVGGVSYSRALHPVRFDGRSIILKQIVLRIAGSFPYQARFSKNGQ